MIVRDEEDSLDACLKSAAPFVDEICVVDTGSKDRSKQIAAAAGARVKTIVWPHHFAEARNVSLEMATGDWVLMLDADEVLEDSGLAAFNRYVNKPRNLAAHLLIRNHYRADRKLECYVMRLWRRNDHHRFCNAIHEQVGPRIYETQGRTAGEIHELDVVIDHYGYHEDTRAARGKNERDRPLFERALREHPGDGYLWYKYGDFLRRFDDVDAVCRTLTRAAELGMALPRSQRQSAPWATEAHSLLALEYVRQGQLESAEPLLRRALSSLQATAMLHWVHGHYCLLSEQWSEALLAFETCMSFDGQAQHMPAQPEITSSRAFFGAARARLGLGETEKACQLFLEGADRWQNCGDLVKAATKVELAQRQLPGALRRITNWLENNAGDSEAWVVAAEVLMETGLFDRAVSFCERAYATALGDAEKAVAAGLCGECYLALGRFEAALESWTEAPQELRSAVGTTLLCQALGEETPVWVDSSRLEFAGMATAMRRRLALSTAAAPLLSKALSQDREGSLLAAPSLRG